MSFWTKKKPELLQPESRWMLDQFHRIVALQYQRGRSKFVISMTHEQFFKIERELNAQQRYMGRENLGGMIIPTIAGTPIFIDRTSAIIPGYEIIQYTDEVLTIQEALEQARKLRDQLGKLKER